MCKVCACERERECVCKVCVCEIECVCVRCVHVRERERESVCMMGEGEATWRMKYVHSSGFHGDIIIKYDTLMYIHNPMHVHKSQVWLQTFKHLLNANASLKPPSCSCSGTVMIFSRLYI